MQKLLQKIKNKIHNDKISARFHYKTITCTNIELKNDFNMLKNLNTLPRHYMTQLILYLKCMFTDSVSGPDPVLRHMQQLHALILHLRT
jgi:hypothetical protein